MSENPSQPGTVSWFDLTTEHAETVRDFYQQVVDWKAKPVGMGDYDDYCMETPDGQVVGGVCHSRGENAGLPPQWLLYINVADLDECLRRCRDAGGRILHGPREVGAARCAVIEDPSGASVALYQPQSGAA